MFELISSSMKPLVSVLTTTYNHEKYIGDAMEGVLMQKCDFPFEYIIGEDCSTDGTREIVLNYKEKYPNVIKPFLQTENKGDNGASMFREMLESSNGIYIALCEGDDYWTDPYKLQKQVDFLENNSGYSFCSSRVYLIDKQNNRTGDYPYMLNNKKVITKDDYLIYPYNIVHTASIFLRRKNLVLKKSVLKHFPVGDVPIVVSLLTEGNGYLFPEKMAVWRKHDGGVWTSLRNDTRYLRSINTYQLLKNHFNIDRKIINKLLKYFYWNLSKFHSIENNIFLSFYYWLKSIRYKSVFVKNNSFINLKKIIWLNFNRSNYI